MARTGPGGDRAQSGGDGLDRRLLRPQEQVLGRLLPGRAQHGRLGGGDVDDGYHRQLHDLPGHAGVYLFRKLALHAGQLHLPAGRHPRTPSVHAALQAGWVPVRLRIPGKTLRHLGAALCRRGLHPVPDVSAGGDPLRGLPAHQGHDRVFAALGDRDLRGPGGHLHHCRRSGGSHLDRPDPGLSP